MIEKAEVYKSLKVSRTFQNGMESETTKNLLHLRPGIFESALNQHFKKRM